MIYLGMYATEVLSRITMNTHTTRSETHTRTRIYISTHTRTCIYIHTQEISAESQFRFSFIHQTLIWVVQQLDRQTVVLISMRTN